MVNIPVTQDFSPIIMRRKESNPEGSQYELWVIEEDGTQYYRHGVYKDQNSLMRIANIVGHARMFAEYMTKSQDQ